MAHQARYEVIGKMLGNMFVTLILVTASNLSNAATYNLAADWSDVSNPSGVWSYNGNDGALLTSNIADWDPTNVFFGSAQPAWAAATFPNTGHVPMWFKRSSDATTLDIPVGVVGMHGSESWTTAYVGVSWASPINGSVDISGGVWQATHDYRNSDWRIRINSTVLTSGNLSGTDSFTSSSPFDLLAGSGGAAALTNLSVLMGDVIVLEFISPTSFATFNGVDLTVTGVPVPAALWLFGSGLLGLIGISRRRKAA